MVLAFGPKRFYHKPTRSLYVPSRHTAKTLSLDNKKHGVQAQAQAFLDLIQDSFSAFDWFGRYLIKVMGLF